MAEKHTVAMFVQGEDGRRVQVGWASPKDNSGVRTFEYSPGYEETRPKDVSFEDDELTQEVAEEQHEARAGDGSDAPEFEVAIEPAREDVPFGEFPSGSSAPQIRVQEGVTDAQNAEPVVDAPDEELAADPITEQPDPEQADDPTDAGVEDEEFSEEEKAEFQRLLDEEDAANKEAQPQTRRELRDNEEDTNE